MKVVLAIEELHRAEGELALELDRLGERHAADHEIRFLAHDLARWSRGHVELLAKAGERYGKALDPEAPSPHAVTDAIRATAADLLGTRPEPALLLLADLRHVHRLAVGASLDWEVLGQSAQAIEDQPLLRLVKHCHPDTLRQARWANAHVKAVAAQALVS